MCQYVYYYPFNYGFSGAFMIREFHYEDFLPLKDLAQKKVATKTSISLVIPTLNEAATVGSIIAKAGQELMQDAELIDEIIVMDSCSGDDTQDIAKKAGATVYRVDEVAPEFDVPPGKGSALWKSQFVAKGDIVICVDADIKNFQSHFIFGLIGPFFLDPEVIFAKAYYKRPLLLENHAYENYGGRVTEILVRPLLAAFTPELARIHQPLSGEYAFRRVPVQTIPFSSGYGVEIGMIFDVLRTFGPKRVVQVDMGTRCHRNRTVKELGRMSLGIIQTMMRKLEREQKLSIHAPVGNVMISQGETGLEETVVREIEIPAFSDAALLKKKGAL
jgi:glucosyl-3-phosphoglycerate synthase